MQSHDNREGTFLLSEMFKFPSSLHANAYLNTRLLHKESTQSKGRHIAINNMDDDESASRRRANDVMIIIVVGSIGSLSKISSNGQYLT